MTFPAKDKTWQFGAANAFINQAFVATGTALASNRNVLLGLINSLLGMGTLPWQTRGSCNGGGNTVTTNYIACIAQGAAGPATNLITSTAALIWAAAGTAHSWIVLRQTGISSFFELLISCEGAASTGHLLTVIASTVGFTGGTGLARPTATDETPILTGAAWGVNQSDSTVRLHVEQSTDGQCTRMMIFNTGICTGMFLIDKPKNPVTGWTNPFISTWQGSSSGGVCFGLSTFFQNPVVVGRGNANFVAYLTQECYASGQPISSGRQAANDLSGEWPAPGIGIYSLTAGNAGRHGEVFDLRWAITLHANATPAPASGTNDWETCEDAWFPWTGSGTTMLTA